nr:GFA family protein [uncultured Rhodoferax sp.]
MLHGTCHCGAVSWDWTHNTLPEGATACNCTVCRRYGVLWIYDFEGQGIHVAGPTKAYIRGNSVEFHFCTTCGCVAFWRAQQLPPEGQRRIAVNLRLTEPEPIASIPIDHFDGLDRFDDLPRDGRCVADMWF